MVGTDLVAARREVARALGAAAAVEPGEVREAVGRLTDGRGADCAILTVGAPAVVREALEVSG